MPNRRELGYVSAGSTSTIPATTGYGVATGGTSSSITVSSENYTLLTFTSDSNLVVSSAGLFDVFLVGGGGSGGGFNVTEGGGGGGGGGGVLQTTVYLDASTFAVDVGAGSTATSTTLAQMGFGSSIGTTARSISVGGGGCGGNTWSVAENPGLDGATGGGGHAKSGAAFQPAGRSYSSTIVGYNGGTGTSTGSTGGGGGGGGATAVGGNGTTAGVGGAGGAGYDVSAFISGSAYVVSAGAGGGATTTGGTAPTGGVAGKTTGTGNNGVNYGAGGGGTRGSAGGNGAAGVVYVRFKV